MAEKPMSHHEFRLLGERRYGHDWQQKLAAEWGHNPRTIARLASGKLVINEHQAAKLRAGDRFCVPNARMSVAEREHAAADALRPELERLVEDAGIVGWEPGEVADQALAWLLDRWCRASGTAATRARVLQALERLPAGAGKGGP